MEKKNGCFYWVEVERWRWRDREANSPYGGRLTIGRCDLTVPNRPVWDVVGSDEMIRDDEVTIIKEIGETP